MGEIYSLKIMQIAGNAPAPGQLDKPDAQIKRISKVCGSSVEVSLILTDGMVSAYGQETNACVLGQASASVLANNIVGTAPLELRELRLQMEAMLKNDGPPPSGKWADLAHLQPVSDYPQRHASTMLVFNAVVQCLDEIEAQSA